MRITCVSDLVKKHTNMKSKTGIMFRIKLHVVPRALARATSMAPTIIRKIEPVPSNDETIRMAW